MHLNYQIVLGGSLYIVTYFFVLLGEEKKMGKLIFHNYTNYFNYLSVHISCLTTRNEACGLST